MWHISMSKIDTEHVASCGETSNELTHFLYLITYSTNKVPKTNEEINENN